MRHLPFTTCKEAGVTADEFETLDALQAELWIARRFEASSEPDAHLICPSCLQCIRRSKCPTHQTREQPRAPRSVQPRDASGLQ